MIIYAHLKDRIEFARNRLGISKTALAKSIGYSLEGYRAIEDGRTQDPRNKKKIIKTLQVDPGWLFLEDGGVVVYTKNGDAIPVPVNHVPLYPSDQISENMESSKINNQDDVVPVSRKCSLRSYAITVKGDAMVSPFAGKLSFNEGDILVIDPERKPVNGDFVILKVDKKEVIFKKYVNEGENTYFSSINPEYKPIKYTQNVKILGVVVERKNYF